MSSTTRPLFTDGAPLNALKTKAREAPDANLREVARQFEAIFTHMLMKNMRAASFGPGAMDSEQGRFYRDMFDQQLSTELAGGKGLGIADLLVQQLGGQSQPPSATADKNYALDGARRSRLGAAGAANPANPAAFVKRLAPHAARIGKLLGVAPRLILAQAALETGWGKREIRGADGSDSHNLFGIKANGAWSGPKALVATMEFMGGVARRQLAAFRAYASESESFDDYAALLSGSSRYRAALNRGDDSAAFGSALAAGGYATDPNYAHKLSAVADGKTMREALRGIKFP